MPRHSKSKLWPQNSKLAIYKHPTDIILHKQTDENGHVQTNKKGWERFKATVILGAHKDTITRVEVTKEALIWTCDITSRGRLSALANEGKTYSNEHVTVLIHVV